MTDEVIMPAGEIVVDAKDTPIDEETLVLGKKETKVQNKVSKKNGKKTVNGLLFKNVAVIYKDEIEKICRDRIDLTIPAVEPSWYQPAIRKRLSLWFDEQNVLPTAIMQVSLPSSGGKEVEMPAEFLEKRIGDFTKEDCVNAAIYYRCRTVKSALGFDEEEMQRSLFLHLHNLDRLDGEHFVNGESVWREIPFDPDYTVPEK